ncbi:hypothetical protein AALP_AAs39056U000500 [Arabis alpina]|uniref:Retrotransposon gag domain-containing protein n=1 Tax=Arabis alpina TaxID=50452 RepID=A0A087G1I1_ARAAL|nr:hypothetical protein AALP_AAs39056U000500 [Arabis alpina]
MSRALLELQQELSRLRIEQKESEKAHLEALVEERLKYSKEVERLERRFDADGVSRERAKDSSSTSFVVTPSIAAPMFIQREGKAVVEEPRGTQPRATGFLESGVLQTGSLSQGWRPPEHREFQMERRMELPLFDGGGIEEWIIRVEQYFDLGEFTEEEILRRFTAESDTSAGERLMTLRQTGSVKDFCRDFIAPAANAPELQDTALELAFMVGLRPSIRARMKSFAPRHLNQMMSVAKTVAEWDLVIDESPTSQAASQSVPNRLGGPHVPMGARSLNGLNQGKPIFAVGGNAQTGSFSQTDRRNPSSHNRVKPPYRRLTQTEMAERKAAGLCFRCDERWHSRHSCSKKELLVLIAQPDGADRVWEYEDTDEGSDDGGDLTELAALSLHSLVGISSPNTMKLEG